MTNQEASFILANIDRAEFDDTTNYALDMAIFALTALDKIRNEIQYLLPPTNVDLKYYDGYVDARNQIVEIIDKYTKGDNR